MRRGLCASLLVAACYEPSLVVDAAEGSKHAACAMSLPDELPEDPDLVRDDEGAPRYNVSDVCAGNEGDAADDCSDDTSLPPCPDGVSCARIDSAQAGFCLPTDVGAGSVAFTYRGGACFERIAPRLKTALCCRAADVDCRRFPLARGERRSAPGELCSQRSDCEPGLLCAAVDAGGSAARCVCPGIDATRLVNEPICGD
jgi:hypothetical protein